ncbi:MAG: hypothetical protein AB8I08_21445 [Sandaracinaceae bacterium]
MTHRDELLALKARVEAQAQELDEAKSEIELLRAAHANKTHQLEGLRREVELEAELRAQADSPVQSEPNDGIGFENDGPPLRPPNAARDIARSFHLGAMVMIGVAMASGLMMTAAASRHAHLRSLHGQRAMSVGSFDVTPVSPLIRTGTVVETSGPALLEVGETCTISRIPVDAGQFDCRVVVGCGGQVLYGADPRTGYVRCDGQEIIEDANMTAFDGDPAMRLDLAHDTVVVEERVGLGTQRIRIQL